MTNKLEIPRELADLIDRIADYTGPNAHAQHIEELRALLAADPVSKIERELGSPPAEHMAWLLDKVLSPGDYPVDVLHEQIRSTLEVVGNPVPPLIQTLHANGDLIAAQATIAQQAQRIADLERGRGESVGIPRISGIGRDADYPKALVLYLGKVPDDDDVRAIQNVLRAPTEQPAPVAVVNLRNFANSMIDIALEGGNADGIRIQELAVEHGLLKPEQRTERCGDACSCAEYADFPVECFRKVKALNA